MASLRSCGVIVDLDNTLVDGDFSKKFYERILKKAGLVGKVSIEELRGLLRRYHFEKVKEKKYKEAFNWDAIFKEMMKQEFSIHVEPTLDQITEEDIHSEDGRKLVHGARELLDFLRRNVCKTILLTNGYAKYQVPVIKFFGLDKYFDRILTAEYLQEIKPTRIAYDYVISYLKENGCRKTVMIGDHLFYDLYGALNSGVNFVILRRDHCYRKGLITIEKLLNEITQKERFYNVKTLLESFKNRVVACFENCLEIVEFLENDFIKLEF
ncbi:MAG: HAD family hydrolase [Candidatus Njordarchaeia archaeon]|nr:HAD family hydrolase [Candidatus Korarchaeota archaeon]